MLKTEVDADAVASCRQLDSVFSQFAAYIGVEGASLQTCTVISTLLGGRYCLQSLPKSSM